MADDDTIDIGEDMAPRKRKTTYNREHPTENPKPQKRSKAEIQAAAAEKRAISIAKKKEKASLQAAVELDKQQNRQKSLKEVAAMEDAIQRKKRQHQLQAERPDLQTMKTYHLTQEAHAALAVENASATEEIQQYTGVEIPPSPQSIQVFNADSEGGLLGVEKNINFDQPELDDEGEDDDGSDIYMPGADNDDDLEEEEENDSSDEAHEGKTSKKKRAKKEKVRIPISQEFI